MPYQSITELPDGVKDNLPEHAQHIYQEAYNSAWDQYAQPSDRRDGLGSCQEKVRERPRQRQVA